MHHAQHLATNLNEHSCDGGKYVPLTPSDCMSATVKVVEVKVCSTRLFMSVDLQHCGRFNVSATDTSSFYQFDAVLTLVKIAAQSSQHIYEVLARTSSLC